MLRRFSAVMFAVILAVVCIGCEESEPAPRTLPTIPPGYESKPGTGGMDGPTAGKKKTATDQDKAAQDKAAAPKTHAAAPAGDAKAANAQDKAAVPKTHANAPTGDAAAGNDTKKNDTKKK